MDIDSLVGQKLASVWLSHPRAPVPPAWVDATTPDINSSFVNLAFADLPAAQLLPCEVNVPNQYPSLGIELSEMLHSPHVHYWSDGSQAATEKLIEIERLLPATITEARLWDALGEGSTSAIDLVLTTGVALTIRHIYPPMTLGIDIRFVNVLG